MFCPTISLNSRCSRPSLAQVKEGIYRHAYIQDTVKYHGMDIWWKTICDINVPINDKFNPVIYLNKSNIQLLRERLKKFKQRRWPYDHPARLLLIVEELSRKYGLEHKLITYGT